MFTYQQILSNARAMAEQFLGQVPPPFILATEGEYGRKVEQDAWKLRREIAIDNAVDYVVDTLGNQSLLEIFADKPDLMARQLNHGVSEWDTATTALKVALNGELQEELYLDLLGVRLCA